MQSENKNAEELAANSNEMYDTSSMLIHLDNIATKRLSRTAAAFDTNHDNFYELCESVALDAADGWKEFENTAVAPHIQENGAWLRDTLSRWPILKVELAAKRQAEEAEARGRFIDVIEHVTRERGPNC